MTTMTGYDVFQANILGCLWHVEFHFQILASKDIRIALTNIIYSVQQRHYLAVRQSVARNLAFLQIQIHAYYITFWSPCIDEYTYIRFLFQYWVKVSDVLCPCNTICPLVNINRFALLPDFMFVIITYTKRSHETHQLNGWDIVFTWYDTDELFILSAVYSREFLFALGNVQQVDC